MTDGPDGNPEGRPVKVNHGDGWTPFGTYLNQIKEDPVCGPAF
ncbi:hypothetical protein [Cumulibacter soli]|nr:hypothetical protein [Cumulibacter soli]